MNVISLNLICCQLVVKYKRYFDMFYYDIQQSMQLRQTTSGWKWHSLTRSTIVTVDRRPRRIYNGIELAGIIFFYFCGPLSNCLYLFLPLSFPLPQNKTNTKNMKTQSKVHISRRHRRHLPFFRTCVPILFVFSVILVCTVMIWQYYALYEQLTDNRSKIEQGDLSFTEGVPPRIPL